MPAPAIYAGGAALVAPYANPTKHKRRTRTVAKKHKLPPRKKNGEFRKKHHKK